MVAQDHQGGPLVNLANEHHLLVTAQDGQKGGTIPGGSWTRIQGSSRQGSEEGPLRNAVYLLTEGQ